VTLGAMALACPSSRGRPWLLAAVVMLLASCRGCSLQGRGEEASAADAQAASEGVRPVYDVAGPVDPRAARLCQALYALPEERRATCCGSRPGIVLAEACAGVLSAALQSKSLVLEGAPLEACTLALAHAYQGCEWVGAFGPPFPKECQGLFTGRRAAGEACRSSLECAGRLLCAGAGPTDWGRCAPPAEKGASCSTAVDALATYTRQDLDRSHPQCLGLCRRHRCEAAVAEGAVCATSQQCEVGQRCAAGHCVRGFAEEGQACSGGDCAPGLRCLEKLCFLPLAAGAPCTSDFECRGGCLATAGTRRCAMRCDLR
jgi:hypothetical protein